MGLDRVRMVNRAVDSGIEPYSQYPRLLESSLIFAGLTQVNAYRARTAQLLLGGKHMRARAMPAMAGPWRRALFAVALPLALASCALSGPADPAPVAGATNEPTAKPEHVSGELLRIYEQKYPSTLKSRACTDFHRTQADLSNYVVVDALAKENADLLMDQLTSFGLAHAQVAAPLVSGYFPICAIPQLETCCSELRFIRQSISVQRQP